ncbi:MAG: type IV pilin protein [Bacillota bacterium]|jgi:prepilin-type N-terminal cleavage/methylation domain-containing protein
MKRDQRGFTLMELMIVIVIIGVLAAIGIPAYNNYVNKAKAAACQSNRRSIATAMGLYYAEKGEYPSAITDEKLGSYINNLSDLTCPRGGTYSVEQDNGKVCIVCSHVDAKNPHDNLVIGTGDIASP